MHSFRSIAALKGSSLVPKLLLLPLFASTAFANSQPRTVNATIDTTKTGDPISRYIYGQFLEHGGDIVNTGVWSEMLVDRKFFYPVVATAPTPPPVIASTGGNPRFRRTPTRWWAPMGGADVVTMDSKSPYTGDQSPLVKLDLKEPHGLSQSGIAVRKGNDYTGRIVLAGSQGASVKVTLIWGREVTAVKRSRSAPSAQRTASSPCATRPRSIPMMQPLDVSAALSEDRKNLAIAVLNPSDPEQSIKLAINGARLAGSGKLWRMAPDSIDAMVQVDKKSELQVEEQLLGALPDTITVRPFSVNIYSYPVQ